MHVAYLHLLTTLRATTNAQYSISRSPAAFGISSLGLFSLSFSFSFYFVFFFFFQYARWCLVFSGFDFFHLMYGRGRSHSVQKVAEFSAEMERLVNDFTSAASLD